MNFEETEFWVAGLFPADPQVSELSVRLPESGRHGADDEEHKSLRIAAFPLYDGSDSHEPDRKGETAAATLELGRNYVGLTGPEQLDIRVELFHVGYADFPVAELVAAAGALVEQEPEFLSPIPGRVLPGAVRLAADVVGGAQGSSGSEGVTVAHLLCTVPYVWSDGVPHVKEQAGKVSRHEGSADPESPHGRMTTMTQLVPITDAELAFYEQFGPQALLGKLAEMDADLRDWCRESVVSADGAN